MDHCRIIKHGLFPSFECRLFADQLIAIWGLEPLLALSHG